ncbi:MAG: hypothetical protein RR942_18870 [Romboutsia sp.]
MIRIMMKDGSEYETDYKNTTDFIENFLKDKLTSNGELPCKLVKIDEGSYINLNAISSIEEEIDIVGGIDSIIP